MLFCTRAGLVWSWYVKLQNLGLACWTVAKSGEGIPFPPPTPDHRLDDDDVKTLPKEQCHFYHAVNPTKKISEEALILPAVVKREQEKGEQLTLRMNESSIEGQELCMFY